MPVWHALSDLFLDTEPQPDDYRRIAGCLRASGFERKELRAILDEEVAPAFLFNLLDIAGEWCPWSAEEVREIVLRSLQFRYPRSPLRWLRRAMIRTYIADQWSKIEPLLDAG